MRLYVANRMSGLPDNNFAWFDRARDFLASLGHDPVSPADEDRKCGVTMEAAAACEPYGDLWWSRLLHDFSIIPTCEGIAFGPEWRESAGARLERELGVLCHRRFFYVDPDAGTFVPEMIAGLSGVARSGKDTAAVALESDGWARMGFAGPLKDVALGADPIVDATYCHVRGANIERRLKATVSAIGWEEAKTVGDVRGFLQRLGTEGGRRVLGPNFWVQTLFKVNEAERLAIPDVRFPEEKDAIERRGGVVIRIERPGVVALNDHASEHAMDGVDFKHVVVNDGTPDALGAQVRSIVSAHYGGE